MLAAAFETEVNQYLAELAGKKDERGYRLGSATGTTGPGL